KSNTVVGRRAEERSERGAEQSSTARRQRGNVARPPTLRRMTPCPTAAEAPPQARRERRAERVSPAGPRATPDRAWLRTRSPGGPEGGPRGASRSRCCSADRRLGAGGLPELAEGAAAGPERQERRAGRSRGADQSEEQAEPGPDPGIEGHPAQQDE